ncbi:MAG: alpha/beta fold hydrolase [Planctomycetales bacterium]|nr:alpha/beta fold hydrolase [Planctomycetales bacterium]
MHAIHRRFLTFGLLLRLAGFATPTAQAFVDVVHESQVFGNARNYRVLLPAGYDANGDAEYPVVYYLHGWSERYNSTSQGGLRIDDLDAFVAAQDKFIMVLPDGSMNPESSQPNVRPYNIGENHTGERGTPFDVQYKDYFPELVDDVDANFRTSTDRSSRALFGYSMGGFMAFNLAGKYPHLVSALVDHLGSPEFYVGDRERRVLYKKRDMIPNLGGVQVRLQAGTGDFLRFLNAEVNESFQRNPDVNYEYELNVSDHALAARNAPFENFAEGVEFLLNAFDSPQARPSRWHHTDTYAAFDVWGYDVASNLNESGLIALRGVTEGGFEVSTKKWTDEGPYVPGVNVNVVTDAIYAPNTPYKVLDYNVAQGVSSLATVVSDAAGRISVSANHEKHQFGIYQEGDAAELVVLGHQVDEGGRFLTQREPAGLQLKFLNRGGASSAELTATISTLEPNVVINNPVLVLGDLEPGAVAWSPEILVTPNKSAPSNRIDHRIRFDIEFSDGRKEEVFVPQYFDTPDFTDIRIDDGRGISGSRGAPGEGTGNADGIVNPGEKILVHTGVQKLRLYTDDPNVIWLEEEQHSQLLPSVSGPDFRLTSLVQISPSAKPGTKIRFLANYETKRNVSDPIQPIVHWGAVTLTVGGVPEPNTASLGGVALLTALNRRRTTYAAAPHERR